MRWLAVLPGFLATSCVGISIAQAQLSIFNDAYIASWPAERAIAPGSLISIGSWIPGPSLGPPEVQTSPAFPLRTELGGTTVRVTVGETSVDAFVLSTEAHRIRALLPSGTPVGEGTMTVTSNGQPIGPTSIRIERRAFCIYRKPYLQAIAGNVDSSEDLRPNSFTNPARPGQVLVLEGTGLGAAEGDEAAGPLPGNLHIMDLEVLVGGKSARILYAGRSGCCAGADRIMLEAPAGVEGCRVPVVVRFRDTETESNYAYLSISSTGPTCSDPHGWPLAAMERLESTGSLSVGSVGRFNGSYSTFTRTAWGHWGGWLLPSAGTCAIPNESGFPALPSELSATMLDAGPALNWRIPQGAFRTPQILPGIYSADIHFGLFGAGEYGVDNGPGGRDLGPFRATFTIPEFAFRSNISLDSVTRSKSIPVTWSGGDPVNGYVVIVVDKCCVLPNEEGYTLDSFVCIERADKGRFEIPSTLLSRAVPTQVGNLQSVHVALVHESMQRFSASGLDVGEFVYDSVWHSSGWVNVK